VAAPTRILFRYNFLEGALASWTSLEESYKRGELVGRDLPFGRISSELLWEHEFPLWETSVFVGNPTTREPGPPYNLEIFAGKFMKGQ
jgi:hypothetical protein